MVKENLEQVSAHAKPNHERTKRAVGHHHVRPTAPSTFNADVDMTDTDHEKSQSPAKSSRVSRTNSIRANKI